MTTQQIAEAEALSLLAAAFNGMPDPVFHLTACAVAISIGLAAIEPDPRAAPTDMMLDAALQAATGLQQLLQFRGNVVHRDDRRAARHGDRAAAERANAAGGRGRTIAGFFKLAEANRCGRPDRRERPELTRVDPASESCIPRSDQITSRESASPVVAIAEPGSAIGAPPCPRMAILAGWNGRRFVRSRPGREPSDQSC